MAALTAMSGVCRSPDPLSRHRSQYKCSTPPWKDTYRKRCKERLRDSRQKFLGKFRQTDEAVGGASVIDKVMDEEWTRLSKEHADLPQWKPTRRSFRPFSNVPLEPSEEADINEILSVMDEIQQELMEEEKLILAQYDENQKFEEESLCAAIEGLKTDDVICPVCKRNPLHQNKQVIFCCCGIRIDTETDCISLPYVKAEIESSVATHNSEGCGSEPTFVVSKVSGLQVSNLIMQCNDCGFLYIII
ncbi:predicted protein [Nematostella vectensis]|uniref:RPA-interacting protein n=1 Tax=Nematostella vectensis TaxID=45351 RepID=A7SU16_NEMVE|nr:RPA-interacting protein A [Nematostella vectensis]EDO32784.1 predicted protein [Nematostella vectensis]|eukprot:XP_001624884.1 predicted protein [Nematostella vectensis]